MKKLWCLGILINLSVILHAQPARDSIIAVVNQFFTAMKNTDTILLKNSLSPNAVFQTIEQDKSMVKVADENVAEFIGFIGKESINAADEQIVVETVKTDGAMAMVWAPYKFYYKGKFSHCGVDSFQLVRLKDGWKIQYIIDTRRKGDCK